MPGDRCVCMGGFVHDYCIEQYPETYCSGGYEDAETGQQKCVTHCGNGWLEEDCPENPQYSERCDGSAPDGETCTGGQVCRRNCQCGDTTCGNQVVRGDEECEWPLVLCPDADTHDCQRCRCVPWCGNGTREHDEECDHSASATGCADHEVCVDCQRCAPADLCGNESWDRGDEVCDASASPTGCGEGEDCIDCNQCVGQRPSAEECSRLESIENDATSNCPGWDDSRDECQCRGDFRYTGDERVIVVWHVVLGRPGEEPRHTWYERALLSGVTTGWATSVDCDGDPECSDPYYTQIVEYGAFAAANAPSYPCQWIALEYDDNYSASGLPMRAFEADVCTPP